LAACGIHGWETPVVCTPVIRPSLIGAPLGATRPDPETAVVAEPPAAAVVVGFELDADLLLLPHAATTRDNPDNATIQSFRAFITPP
jgi:hypothetical protein